MYVRRPCRTGRLELELLERAFRCFLRGGWSKDAMRIRFFYGRTAMQERPRTGVCRSWPAAPAARPRELTGTPHAVLCPGLRTPLYDDDSSDKSCTWATRGKSPVPLSPDWIYVCSLMRDPRGRVKAWLSLALLPLRRARPEAQRANDVADCGSVRE